MKSKVTLALTLFLWGICAFHLIVGLGLNVSGDFPQLMAQYYGAQVNWTPEFLYILKPVGAFMFALGVGAIFAAREPLGHPAVVYSFVALFIARGLQRFAFQGDIETLFNIAGARNTGTGIFFLVMGVALLLLFRAASKQPAT